MRANRARLQEPVTPAVGGARSKWRVCYALARPAAFLRREGSDLAHGALPKNGRRRPRGRTEGRSRERGDVPPFVTE
jgi:hypothetical protein